MFQHPRLTSESVLWASILLGLLVTCQTHPDRWTLSVYPNKHDLTVYENLGPYQSLEECRNAARKWLAESNLLEVGDYECGKNCEYQKEYGDILICEETLR